MPAAGSARRFGGTLPKQHATLGRSTVVETSLAVFLADGRCAGVVLAMTPGDPRREALRGRLPTSVLIVDGGAERSASVLAGLEALTATAQPEDWVLVHDAVRPCLSHEDLELLLAAGAASAAGAVLAAAVTDTIKAGDSGRRSIRTVPREDLWRALTPQMFRYRRLCEALGRARAGGREPTDEAQAVEWLGDRPLLVAARDSNPKITTGEDLAVAAAILSGRAAAARGERAST